MYIYATILAGVIVQNNFERFTRDLINMNNKQEQKVSHKIANENHILKICSLTI